MTRYAAFLRAVNVGGTGKLPMADLRKICRDIGFTDIQTYIASGNVLFSSTGSKRAAKAVLQDALRAYADKSIGVVMRTATELRTVLEKNPFSESDPKRTVAILLDQKPPTDALANLVGRSDEQLSVGEREIYVYYTSGIGSSKLRIPAAKEGTARNMNTIAKMVALASNQSTAQS